MITSRGAISRSRIAAAQTSDVSQLQGFAAGLLKDYDAVRNGLTLPWSWRC
ncbi:hypothetical protein [Saccharopolyspora pogona]|uniref:hypothetical protein n=1 Tax=Saccharopolyspora pogona TaxID=333966 RepID=UPI0016858685|nr:hypothetical protein [Saccharopolyspora pogona]